ncbi:hypothetical protein [Blastococcus deserti]|uniref:Uncharacterized protein n=1 Tax=Blastococcus deserti TaxID=2259033 RepID=A0ABW4XE45_9ACTN
MTDPPGSDRIQQDIPTASGSGDNSDSGATGSSFDEVPLTRDEALDRDAANGDDLPAGADSDVARARGAAATGEVSGVTSRSGGRDA